MSLKILNLSSLLNDQKLLFYPFKIKKGNYTLGTCLTVLNLRLCSVLHIVFKFTGSSMLNFDFSFDFELKFEYFIELFFKLGLTPKFNPFIWLNELKLVKFVKLMLFLIDSITFQFNKNYFTFGFILFDVYLL